MTYTPTIWPKAWACFTIQKTWFSISDAKENLKCLPISSLCLGDVRANTISSLAKLHHIVMSVNSCISEIKRTLIPLPALQSVDIISMNDNSAEFIIVDHIRRSPSLLSKRIPRISNNEVDLASDGFSSLRVVTLCHNRQYTIIEMDLTTHQ
jgi:hypothetical protein